MSDCLSTPCIVTSFPPSLYYLPLNNTQPPKPPTRTIYTEDDVQVTFQLVNTLSDRNSNSNDDYNDPPNIWEWCVEDHCPDLREDGMGGEE